MTSDHPRARAVWVFSFKLRLGTCGGPRLDDVVRLCDVLGIDKPIVRGNSFGGFVAQRYIGRHPEHPAGVVPGSTVAQWDHEAVLAKFSELGGVKAVEAAAAFWAGPTPETRQVYLNVCGPLYTQSPSSPGSLLTHPTSPRSSTRPRPWRARGPSVPL